MKKLPALLFITLFFVTCKRDVTLSPSPKNTTQFFYLTNDTDFYARFQFLEDQNTSYYNPLANTSYQAIADFSSVPASHYNPATLIAVDSVFLDNVFLSYDSASKRYDSYSNYPLPHSIINNNTWRVLGANGIPSFVFNQNPMPTFDYTLVPDTIDHTKPITIPIHITSSNYATVGFDSPTKIINPQVTNSVSFSSADLSNRSNYIYFYVYAYNINSYKVFGKTMNFRCTFEFFKTIYLK